MSYFITFEGIDGSGKSSTIKLLIEKLNKDGYQAISTREPGGSVIAEQVRNVILDVNNTNMDYMTEMLLFAACRSQHLKDIVIPNLEKGNIVICDRFVDSSYVYQGIARNIGLDSVMAINDLVIKDCKPDLTIYIDIEPETGLQRINKNNRNKDRLDLESLEFLTKVRNGYLKIAEMFKERIVVVNGDQPLEKVVDDAYEIIVSFLKGKNNA